MMNSLFKTTFLVLIVFQGLHSLEEYLGKLWEVFPPARILTGMVSENLETGFLIINISLFVFGLWCWFFPILKEYYYAPIVVWFWVVLETINGIGHSLWAISQQAYTPGLITAPLLLAIAIYLGRSFYTRTNRT